MVLASSHHFEPPPGCWRELSLNAIARSHFATCQDDGHHAGLADKPAIVVPAEDSFHKALLKPIDLNARVSKTRHFKPHAFTNPQMCPSGELEKRDALGRDVFTEVAGGNLEPLLMQFGKQFRVDQMDLPKVRLRRIPCDA